jgi:hypothetical protein
VDMPNITNLDTIPQSIIELNYDGNPFIYDFKPTLENIREYNTRKN